MHLSPLKLESCYYTDVRITSQSESTPEDANEYEIAVTLEVTSVNPDRPLSRFIFLSVYINPKEGKTPPYVGQVDVMGKFTVDNSWPPDRLEELVYVNGSGLLYASVREMICAITARSFFEMISIPSWSFGKMYAELKEKRKQEQESQDQLKLEPSASAGNELGGPIASAGDQSKTP